MSGIKVALAGATGNLGLPILHGLLEADFAVTVLSRKGGNSSRLQEHSNLAVHEVDFTSVENLTQALTGIEVVICCFATTAIGQQYTLIDAAVAAGVKRFIPAEFGMDSANPACVELPVCKPKAETQMYLQRMANKRPGFSWTAIANGLFLDWGIEVGFIVDPPMRVASLYNGGDVRFSATLLKDVTSAVIGVIRRQAETANRIVYVHSAAVTQNELIGYAKDRDGIQWNTSIVSTDEVKRQGFVELDNGNVDAAMEAFCVVGMWDPACAGDFSDRLDNELLGIEMLRPAEVRALVEGCVPK